MYRAQNQNTQVFQTMEMCYHLKWEQCVLHTVKNANQSPGNARAKDHLWMMCWVSVDNEMCKELTLFSHEL